MPIDDYTRGYADGLERAAAMLDAMADHDVARAAVALGRAG